MPVIDSCMDDKLFKQKLNELTEWEIPKVPNGKGRKPDPMDETELEEDEKLMMPDGTNKTVGPKVIKVKPIIKKCEDCGAECVNRRVEHKYNERNNSWRSQCLSCKLWRDPLTGTYSKTNYELHIATAKVQRIKSKSVEKNQ